MRDAVLGRCRPAADAVVTLRLTGQKRQTVMPALVAGIHDFLVACTADEAVDGRVKPGHDEVEVHDLLMIKEAGTRMHNCEAVDGRVKPGHDEEARC